MVKFNIYFDLILDFPGSGSAMRVIDSYKDAETNSFTLRRQEERMKEEAEQLNRLRMV